jgi:biopolymer transport protein ExbB
LSIAELWGAMAPMGKIVVGLLALLSLYSLGVMIERSRVLSRTRNTSDDFSEEIDRNVLDSGVETVTERALAVASQGPCALATVIGAGLEEYDLLKEEAQNRAVVMEGVDEAVGRSLDSVVADLRTNLSGLATIVGIAPFLGLCGTVLGLMDAFAGLESAGDFPKVVDGISAALATTVFGLFVAMPSLWAYNYFMNRIDVMALDLENTGARIVSHVVRRAIRQRLGGGGDAAGSPATGSV